MATELRLRGGTTAQHASFTGATKEITVDTTKNTVVVHDGSTAGGYPLLNQTDLNNTLTSTSTSQALTAAQGKVLQDSTVKLTGNQTIAGVKTFSAQPAISATQGTGANAVLKYGTINTANSAPVKTALNATGSVPIYACRAWVNFNGVNGNILGSGNVSSITKVGTGNYRVNFTIAMPDTNGSTTIGGWDDGVTGTIFKNVLQENINFCTVFCVNQGPTFRDVSTICLAVFR